MRVLFLLLCLLVAPATHAATTCAFQTGSVAAGNVVLPATLSIPRNATRGTILWDSGQRLVGSNTVRCLGPGQTIGHHAAGIGMAVPGFTGIGGRSTVFETNVPGIGVSLFWCHMTDCTNDPAASIPLPSFASSPGWAIATGVYHLKNHWRALLIKTGDIDVSPGTITIDGLSSISYVDQVLSTMTLTGSTQVTGLGCEVNPSSLNIDVLLPTISKEDFSAALPNPPGDRAARAFSIDLLCDRGVKVNYLIDGVRSGAASNVLANADGQGMATGIGVQLFQGDASSSTVLALGSKVMHVKTATHDGVPVTIPLAAKYYRTAASIAAIGPGRVSTTATFTLTYE